MIQYLIEVYENNDTLLTLHLVDEDTEEPFDLSPFEAVEMVIKADPADADADALATYSASVINATNGDVIVQTVAADLATPGSYRYRVDTLDGADPDPVLRVTRMAGPFVVLNV